MLGLSWPELHGALTHFPVALLITGLVFDVAAAIWQRPAGRVVGFWLLVVAVVMAVPALATGWLAGNALFAGTASPPAVFVSHRIMAFTTAALAIILLAWRLAKRDQLSGGALWTSLLLSLVVAATVGYTGYLGGRMVFQGG